MSSATIYLDESGDLGWLFDKKYRYGSSSRFLTISSILCHSEKTHIIKRSIKDLAMHFKHPPKKELKWNELKSKEKIFFCNLIPYPRSIKVKSGNSLPDYLQTKLWFENLAETKLIYHIHDSKTVIGLQFADMLAGALQQHYEDGYSEYYNILKPVMAIKPLFFSLLN